MSARAREYGRRRKNGEGRRPGDKLVRISADMAKDLEKIRRHEMLATTMSDRALLQWILDGYMIRIAIYGEGERQCRQCLSRRTVLTQSARTVGR